MPDVERYEILILGSGEAGKYLAWTMAKAGHRTAMVERKYLGGSCPNVACLPSKNLIYSAKVASLARRGAEFGLENRFALGQHGERSAPQADHGRRAASVARGS
jgi:pyruvate/2-oxoglutarate dehydrogenase complex dihydrolipoamide dehydrogenase (E3) component